MAAAPTSTIAVLARLEAAPGKRAELVDALQQALVNADDEPGTRIYLMHTDDSDDDAVWFYEMYADRDALDAHRSTDGFKALGAAIAGLVAGRPELTFLTPVGGKGIPTP